MNFNSPIQSYHFGILTKTIKKNEMKRNLFGIFGEIPFKYTGYLAFGNHAFSGKKNFPTTV